MPRGVARIIVKYKRGVQLEFWAPDYLYGQGEELAPPSQSWESGLESQESELVLLWWGRGSSFRGPRLREWWGVWFCLPRPSPWAACARTGPRGGLCCGLPSWDRSLVCLLVTPRNPQME